MIELYLKKRKERNLETKKPKTNEKSKINHPPPKKNENKNTEARFCSEE